METIKLLNLGLRFLLEICLLVIFGYWGFKTGSYNTFMKFLLGIGVPALFAFIWGVLLAPKATIQIGEPWRLILELIIFGLACWALFSTSKTSLALAFGAIYLVNKILMIIWKQ